MKAAVLERLNHPLVVTNVGLSQLLYGQVLVKNLVTGICGAQLEEIKGHKGNGGFVPHLLGHEACGIVQDVGEGVLKVKSGDKVCLHWRKGSGIDSDFPRYIYNGREIQSGKVTTFSEYSIVSENRLTPVPFDTPNDLTALLGCALSTALGVIKCSARVQYGESVLIIGVGGIGLNLVRYAVQAGAYPVVAVDVADKELLARRMGAHFFVNRKQFSLVTALNDVVGITSADVVISTIGDRDTIEESVPLLSGVGRYVMVGQPVPGNSIQLLNAAHFFEGEGKVFMATQSGGFNPSVDIPRYLQMAKSGHLSLENIITGRTKLDHINDALNEIRAGLAGRIMIDL
ncbi:zinc-binding dehydrogenase [Cyanobium sp. HWJ4-Hawea]|uniref:zinc-binding dehydrogenase n=1 Tax=Cyanobium sp. HWJ4-Hawea TaxID=2823713 RepID=UPI0020CE89E3|nr:zinc-binding dehydrogenase [Cyanobium sp. HWJ4-Hawea]